LVIKAYGHHTLDLRGLTNVRVITDAVEESELIDLVHSCHVLVYPSWGEGFGMIPLQALATGMPTISTSVWANYRRHLEPLQLLSMPEPSPWPDSHPGMMYRPDERHLAMLMKEVYYNYRNYSDLFFDKATSVHEEYDWDVLVKEAFDPIVKQFG
jgi:glycosyltransferase involved in cell wall biosynthesis